MHKKITPYIIIPAIGLFLLSAGTCMLQQAAARWAEGTGLLARYMEQEPALACRLIQSIR